MQFRLLKLTLTARANGDHKIAMADELGTKTLARLTFRKISRKLRARLGKR